MLNPKRSAAMKAAWARRSRRCYACESGTHLLCDGDGCRCQCADELDISRFTSQAAKRGRERWRLRWETGSTMP